MVRGGYFLTGVHQHKAAGAVSILSHPRLKAGLAEKGCLLVACGAGNGDIGAAEGIRGGIAVYFTGGPHLRQHRPGNGQ